MCLSLFLCEKFEATEILENKLFTWRLAQSKWKRALRCAKGLQKFFKDVHIIYSLHSAWFIFAIIRSAKIRIIAMYCKIPQYPKHWRHSCTKQKVRLQKCRYYTTRKDTIYADVYMQMHFGYEFKCTRSKFLWDVLIDIKNFK